MLKIAAADKIWLEQLVLGERRKLSSLHHAALTETPRNMADHADDKGFKTITGDPSVRTAAFDINAPSLTQQDLETVNEACSFLEDQRPEIEPAQISQMVHEAYEPGLTITQLITKVLPNLESDDSAFAGVDAGAGAGAPADFAHTSSGKKGFTENKETTKQFNDPESYAVKSHEGIPGETIYQNVLDPKTSSKRKQGFTENTKNPNEPDGYATESHKDDKAYQNSLDADPHHVPAKETKEASRKKAEGVPNSLDPKGGNHDPNDPTGYAAESHEKEMKALAEQVSHFTHLDEGPGFSVKTNPNGPIND